MQDTSRLHTDLIEEDKRFLSGEDCRLHDRFGAHPGNKESKGGVRFCVWAPHAQGVSVVGSFNGWDGRRHPMHRQGDTGVWEGYVPNAACGDLYKYEIKPRRGNVFMKTDPYAFCVEACHEAGGIIHDVQVREAPQRPQGTLSQSPRSFRLTGPDPVPNAFRLELSETQLLALKEQGYTHIELANLCYSSSQAGAYFAPDPAIGTPEEVMAFIDRCHDSGLGVIVNGIPSRTLKKQKNLICFDGDPLYERREAREREWNCFDTAKPAVQSFFLSHAMFWIEKYGVDGFRVDSGSFALYRRFSQECLPDGAGIVLLGYEPDATLTVSQEDLESLFHHRHLDNPFAILGPNQHPPLEAGLEVATIRIVDPFVREAYVDFPAEPGVRFEMRRLCADGLWQAVVPAEYRHKPYRIQVVDEAGKPGERVDPYSFDVSRIGSDDKKSFADGNHYRIYEVFGAHKAVFAGVEGINFAVWAPNAAAVSVVGPFNRWDGRPHPMRHLADSGIWELFVPGIGVGELYKFLIRPQHGESFMKSDPYAFFMETAPDTASIVYDLDEGYQWHDRNWLQHRSQSNPWRSPIAIYEVHLGSWIKGRENRRFTYKELGQRLIPYVKKMGFTHIEILPIAEHPYEPSWGYQVSNFYAPTSRLGEPEELMAFVDECHQNGIGVLLDWVAGHFPKDAHALARFDGTHVYEHADPRQGEHKDWGTLIFNYGRHEVENFLIANALFWLERFHFDGLRVDGVASMLYLDYSRNPGEWIPNAQGGNENLEAIEFLKHANSIIHAKFPGILMVAEESTAWPGVSRPADAGGLGFGFKWNMGWMHDVLGYMQTPPEYRPHHHHQLVFVFQYAFEENFVLSLSHDEVVHSKGSLYQRMPGSEWEKFANLRLLFFFMYTHPGKKLNFMGAEFGQVEEWNHAGQLQWPLLKHRPHRLLKQFLSALNHLYRREKALYEMDCRPAGFEWIDAGNHEQSIIAFIRKGKEPRNALIVVINFSAISRVDYRIGVPYPVAYTEVFNSNAVNFGGSGKTTGLPTYPFAETPWHGKEFSIILTVPALTGIILRAAPPDWDAISSA